MTYIDVISKSLTILTVIAQIAIIVLIISANKKSSKLNQFFVRNTLFFSFILALVSTLGSLFYSDIAGYEPCKLCWIQRIFMYPQTILLGMAAYKKDKGIIKYSIILSIIGALIALYHYLIQRGTITGVPCSAVGYSANCSQVFVMTFGYITIPLMALTAFLLMTLLMINRNLNND